MLASGKLRPTYWRAPDTTRSTRMLGISDCVTKVKVPTGVEPVQGDMTDVASMRTEGWGRPWNRCSN